MNLGPGSGVQMEIAIKAEKAALQIVYGEVYAPGVLDSDGEFMSAESIMAMAHEFLASGRVLKVDVEHSRLESGAVIVESFIAREDDKTFIPGAWVVGIRCPDDIWALVQAGEINGFSVDATVIRAPGTLTISGEQKASGETQVSGDVEHNHKFVVHYDSSGIFLGGATDTVQGHHHTISRGTITDSANGHVHRFSFAEFLITPENTNA